MGALFALGHGLKQLFGGVLGVARHESYEKFAGDLVYHGDKVRKIDIAVEILAVGVDILAEQRNVLVALGNQLPCLGDNILGSAAALTPAHIRHDAVGAEVVAAVHNGQPRLDLAVTLQGHALGDIAVAALCGEHTLFARHDPEQKLREVPQVVRPENEIDNGVGALYLLGHMLLLHHAAAHGDYLPGLCLFAVI